MGGPQLIVSGLIGEGRSCLLWSWRKIQPHVIFCVRLC